MSRIDELINMPESEPVCVRNAVLNAMLREADRYPYQVVFYGPWDFEPHIGASEMTEARDTARDFVRRHPETERWEIWDAMGLAEAGTACFLKAKP